MQDRTEGDCEEVPSEASVDPTGAREPAGPSEMSVPKEHTCLDPYCARLSPGWGA